MRQRTAIGLFILIFLAIMIVYAIAALYFDGIIAFLGVLHNVLMAIFNAFKTLFEAIYETFIKPYV